MDVKKKEMQEVTKVIRTDCDLCGKDVDKVMNGLAAPHIIFNVDKIEMKVTDGGPYGGDTHYLEADICFKCMAEKVVPLMVLAGVKFQERTIEW